MIHELKIKSKYFTEQLQGTKPFELRKNDRNYKVGDLLALNEVSDDGKKYSGCSLLCEVTSVVDLADWIENSEGYIILGTRKLWIKFRDGDQELILGKGRGVPGYYEAKSQMHKQIERLAVSSVKASEAFRDSVDTVSKLINDSLQKREKTESETGLKEMMKNDN